MTLNSFQFNTTPGLRFGSGQAKDSCKEIFSKLGQRILFITDKGLMSLGLTNPTIKELQKMGFEYVNILLPDDEKSLRRFAEEIMPELDDTIRQQIEVNEPALAKL